MLDSIIEDFVNKGHEGDICAYAIASDILRIAIIEKIPQDELYIYADCNDIEFLALADDLENLSDHFKKNPLGLSFPINIMEKTPDDKILATEFRNDRIIVRKENNPYFYKIFISMYKTAVYARAPSYIQSDDDRIKKHQADTISCFCGALPFGVTIDGTFVALGFTAPIETIDFSTYISTIRELAFANTWRGVDDEELAFYHSQEDRFDNLGVEYEWRLLNNLYLIQCTRELTILIDFAILQLIIQALRKNALSLHLVKVQQLPYLNYTFLKYKIT